MTQSASKAILNPTREHAAATMSGYPPLLIALLAIPAGIASITQIERFGVLAVAGLVLAIVALLFLVGGFYLIAPNQAYAIQLFGSYKGTDRMTGLRWVLPWLMRKPRRRAQGGDGIEPDGRVVFRARHAAGGQHRHTLPVALP